MKEWIGDNEAARWMRVRMLLIFLALSVVLPLNIMFVLTGVNIIVVAVFNLISLGTGYLIRRKFKADIPVEKKEDNKKEEMPSKKELKKLLSDDEAFEEELRRYNLRKTYDE